MSKLDKKNHSKKKLLHTNKTQKIDDFFERLTDEFSKASVSVSNLDKSMDRCVVEEPDFRTEPTEWIFWNMRAYGNSLEEASILLKQRQLVSDL